MHRDIKPENVLINKNGNCKLSDFGFSTYYESSAPRKTYCGTHEYLAPEIISC